MNERTQVYDELIRQGWTAAEARTVVDHPKSLPYAQARFMANVRALGRAIANAVRWDRQ